MDATTMEKIWGYRDRMLSEHRFLYYAEDIYERINFVWVPAEDHLIAHYLDQELMTEGEELAKCVNPKIRGDLLDYIKSHYMMRREDVDELRIKILLPFTNGYVSIDSIREGTPQLVEYEAEIEFSAYNPHAPMFFHRIPHRIDPARLARAAELNVPETILNELAPLTHSFLCDLVGPEKLLFQLYKIAYCMLPSNPYKCIFIELGEKDAGKTTYINLIKSVIGETNISGESMQRLADYPFSLIELRNKLANIYDDLPHTAISNTGQLKMISGNSPISAPRKFKGPSLFVPYAKPIFSANQLPRLHILDDDAFFSRIIITEYKNRFPRTDFGEKLVRNEEELEGLVIACLYALRDVMGRNVFEQDSARWTELWKRSINSVYDFVKSMEESVVLTRTGTIPKSELYSMYTDYDDNPVSQNKFTMELNRLFNIKADCRMLVAGKQEWAYRGIGRPQTEAAPAPAPTEVRQITLKPNAETFQGKCEHCGKSKTCTEYKGRSTCLDCMNAEQHAQDEEI